MTSPALSNVTATEPFLRWKRWAAMVPLLLASAAIAQVSDATRTLTLCKPVLARKGGGTLDRITVDSATGSRPSQVISGRLTLFIGMPAATPGSARPYHLIRADYSYRCQVRHGRVVKASVTQP